MPDSSPRTILAFDYGLRRIGVAVGQDITGSASPLGTIRNSDAGVDEAAIDRLVQEWAPSQLIVGLPLHPDGNPSDMTEAALAFADGLKRYGLPVAITDERYSSVEATEILNRARAAGQRRRTAKADIDAAAAVLIAERYLSTGG
ncbi:MAG: Holliday junction resolvase RuvX [Woeseiaceae bacterium]|nr:Holliday junction resolvase RuvX [Woeseiaceae bacterium]